jgi:uncharacterized protein YqjF (DUF2071 family)
MLNYAVDPAALAPFVPRGTEVDFFQGRALASMVGFRFLNTRVFGIPFPGHVNFEEVNLRFYVRRRAQDGWRRGVVFIRELVPRRVIAFIARTLYGEPYTALPTRHRVDLTAAGIEAEYSWRRQGHWESLAASGVGAPMEIEAGSEEEFITEHYWGYTARAAGCAEYQVEHPRWRVRRCVKFSFDADVKSLYGDRFVEPLAATPVSAFIADGSPVTVRWKSPLAVEKAAVGH